MTLGSTGQARCRWRDRPDQMGLSSKVQDRIRTVTPRTARYSFAVAIMTNAALDVQEAE